MTRADLSEEQRSAAAYAGRHLLVRGWVGTGKTTVLAARAAFLLDAGVPPEKILILSPTEAGSAAIAEQAKMLTQASDADRLRGWTFQSWCQQLLDRYPAAFGIEGFRLTSSEEVAQFVPRGIDRVGMFLFERIIPVIYARYLRARTSLEDAIYWAYFRKGGYAEKAEEAKRYHRELKQGFDDYIEFKLLNKQYDEIDVQNLIAVTRQNDPTLRKTVASEIEHILVDEVQDVNALQYEILEALSPDCDLSCAGDETQSVRSSQSAEWTSIRRFAERFPDAEERVLTQDFRCTQEIRDLALWVLGRSPLDYRIEIPRTRGAGPVPLLYCSEEKYKLYDAIAEDIRRNVTQYGYRYEDHLVLGREYGDLFGPRISLTKRGIPGPGPETGYRSGNCIRVETFQAAKATEAEIVYLWDISHLHWPRRDDRNVPESREEWRRLLSLGITRARSKVVILCADHPVYLQKSRSKKIVFFLREVGPMVELIDTFEQKKG